MIQKSSSELTYSTWWQVYDYPKIWGFKSRNGYIVDIPFEHHYLIGYRLSELRGWFRERNLQVIKIADLNE